MKNTFWKDSWQLVQLYWKSQEKWRAIACLLVVLAFCTAAVRLQVIANELTKSVYDAIQKFDVKLIIHFVFLYLGIVIIFAATTTLQSYLNGRLANNWRRWLTQYFMREWIHNKAYYHMELTGYYVDNPDQRIAEDVDSICSMTLSLVVGLYTSIFQLVTFTILLWQIGGALTFDFLNHTWRIPGYLFWCVLTYALFNTLITTLIGKRLSTLNYQQQRFNANFRFGLMRLREYSEQIALFRGEKNEEARLKTTYQPIFTNTLDILSVARNLTFFMNTTSFLVIMIGVLFALPVFIRTHATIGTLMQMATLVGYEYDALSFIITAYISIALWRAVASRLTEFSNKINLAVQTASRATVELKTDHAIALDKVTIHLPDGKILQENVSWSVKPGEKVLIIGASGVGKSTILKVIAGLWPFAKGIVSVPLGHKMFLSQKPYLPPVSLLESICFPGLPTEKDREKMESYLHALDLSELIPLLDTVRNWHKELSLGEQQRIAIIRVLLHHPEWLFLDEATASLDENSENKVYALLQRVLPQVTIITVGHRKNLIGLHDRTIEIMA